MTVLLAIAYTSLVLLYATWVLKHRSITPSSLFIFFNYIMMMGVLPLLDLGVKEDQVHLFILCYSMVAIVIADLVSRSVFFIRNSNSRVSSQIDFVSVIESEENIVNTQIIKLIVFSSVILIYAFYSHIGYNVVLLFFRSDISASQITDLRLQSYNTTGILRYGYIYQLRNIILPVCVMYLLYLESIKQRISHRISISLLILTFILSPLVVLFSVGTGQRGGFVIIFLFILMSLYLLNELNAKQMIMLSLIVFIVFSILSVALGRSVIDTEGRVLQNITNQVYEIIKRILIDQQYPQVIGFRYIYNQDIAYGYDWLIMLRNLLPFEVEYVPISKIIFSVIYGSTRGTAPISIWASIYYNFGWFGSITMPIIIVFIYNFIHNRYVIKRQKTIMLTLCYAYVCIILGTWIAEGPAYVLNNGVVSIGLVYFVATKIRYKFVVK